MRNITLWTVWLVSAALLSACSWAEIKGEAVNTAQNVKTDAVNTYTSTKEQGRSFGSQLVQDVKAGYQYNKECLKSLRSTATEAEREKCRAGQPQ